MSLDLHPDPPDPPPKKIQWLLLGRGRGKLETEYIRVWGEGGNERDLLVCRESRSSPVTKLEIIDVEKVKGLSNYYVSAGDLIWQYLTPSLPYLSLPGLHHQGHV